MKLFVFSVDNFVKNFLAIGLQTACTLSLNTVLVF